MANSGSYRIETDSMGELQVPRKALWGAQTQRAVDNFPISGQGMPRAFIRALGLIKAAAAQVNADLGLLSKSKSQAMRQAALAVADGEYDEHFPVDIYQTGSGTSSNMNANEVIARLASKSLGKSASVHPNDDVNMGQSSNDVIPSAIHLSAALLLKESLLPSLKHLNQTIDRKARKLGAITKTGRTHLMDAMPVTFEQEMTAWSAQVLDGRQRIADVMPRLTKLAQGGTAVGSGVNAHPQFGKKVASQLKTLTGIPFKASDNYFQSLSSQDTAVELSSHLKTLAVSLMKISNDLRWMNSGPITGLAEISLQAQQPGSSIMPGKVNPVTPEAVCMVCAEVMGNDVAITVAGQSGNFQLNVMLPLIAHKLLESIDLLGNASRLLADNAIKGFTINKDNIRQGLDRNPILVTALNAVIGYEAGAKIAKQAYKEGRAVLDVALENTDLSKEQLQHLLDPSLLTKGGIPK